FQAEDGIRDLIVTGVQTCALPILGLLNSVPRPGAERLASIEGQPPSLINLPDACRFYPRCHLREPKCLNGVPPLEEKREKHFARSEERRVGKEYRPRWSTNIGKSK